MSSPADLPRRVNQLRHDVDDVYKLLDTTNQKVTAIAERLERVEATQRDHTAVLDQHTAVLDQHTAVLDQHTVLLDQHTVLLDRHTVLLDRHTVLLEQILGRLGGPATGE